MNCPKCGSDNIGKRGFAIGIRRYECRDCHKTFMESYAEKKGNYDEYPCPYCNRTEGVQADGTKGGKKYLSCSYCARVFQKGKAKVSDRARQKDTLIITSAINDSPVNVRFMKSLQTFCEHNDAELIVIPLRYRNPTSKKEAEAQDVTWDTAVLPFLYDGRMRICEGLQLLADIKTQPTAQAPLTGLDGFTGTDCGIVGHPKVALDSIATRGHELPKLMLTTGCCTDPEYSDTVAGKKGEFHHVIGAVVVQVDGDVFHLRHALADRKGEFIDLDTHYSPKAATKAKRPLALTMGDIHAERADPQALRATHEMIDMLRPEKLVTHDVLDFGSAGHHNGYFEKFVRHHSKQNSVIRELRITCDVLDRLHRKDMEVAVISSNHHDHLLRWLSDSRNGEDMENAALFHSLKAEILEHAAKHFSIPNAFELAAKKLLRHPVKWIGDKDSYMMGDVEHAYHGDKGANGSRGSAKAFDKIGVKTVIGHSHSPKIIGGCYQTGTTSMLDMGYNKGPSSWLHSHVITYANQKRSHIHIIDGAWYKDGKRRKAKSKAKAK